eukprot:1309513-Heterocapsa_arctica.AAC.1
MDHWRRLEQDARNDRGIRSGGTDRRIHRGRGRPGRDVRPRSRGTPHPRFVHPRTRVQGDREENR